MKDIVFLPQAPIGKIPQLNKDFKQIPPYEDTGVKFQGYSKKKISQDEYNLTPQYPFTITGGIAGAPWYVDFALPAGKSYYITDIIISGNNTINNFGYMQLINGQNFSDVKILKQLPAFNAAGVSSGFFSETMNINTPLKIDSSYLRVYVLGGGILWSGNLTLTINGWLE